MEKLNYKGISDDKPLCRTWVMNWQDKGRWNCLCNKRFSHSSPCCETRPITPNPLANTIPLLAASNSRPNFFYCSQLKKQSACKDQLLKGFKTRLLPIFVITALEDNPLWLSGFLLFLYFFFGSSWVWIQCFALERQVLYNLSHVSSPFCSGYSVDTVSCFVEATIVLF
jgi:hypothetical protein